MSGQEFQQWKQFFALEPLGERRGDVQAALICSVIVNCMRMFSGKRGGGKFAEVKDYLLEFSGTKVRPSAKDVQTKMRSFLTMMQADGAAKLSTGTPEKTD